MQSNVGDRQNFRRFSCPFLQTSFNYTILLAVQSFLFMAFLDTHGPFLQFFLSFSSLEHFEDIMGP